MQAQPEIDKALTAPTVKALDEVSQAIKKGTIVSNSTALTIGDTRVRQVGGLYSLNDLHIASGGEERHQPGKFMRLDQTQALIAEISNSPDLDICSSANAAFESRKGRYGGTYGCKELVIAYAAWISAAFHLKVIRVFLAHVAPAAMQQRNPAIDYDRISPAQAQDLKQIVQAIVDAGIQSYGETWARLQRKFKVNSYLALAPDRYEEARAYLIGKLPNGYGGDVVDEEPRRRSFEDAVRLDAAFSMATQMAAKVQRAVFKGVMSGNADWRHGRYLLSMCPGGLDEDVMVQVHPVEADAYVLPVDRFRNAIDDSVLVDAETLTQLAATCTARLGRMASRAALGA